MILSLSLNPKISVVANPHQKVLFIGNGENLKHHSRTQDHQIDGQTSPTKINPEIS